MLALPGFIEANNFDPESTDDGRRVHTVQYVLSDQQALDHYLENDAERMRAPALARFGDSLRSTRSVRAVTKSGETSDSEDNDCLNCHVAVTGQYCWNCGQRSNTRLISLFELLKDAVGDMFELDSRLWRTLIPLFLKPGYLTAEYLRGRRAHYMPPFRMYLVLSFLFFLLTTAFNENTSVIDEEALRAVDVQSVNGNAPDVPTEAEPELTGISISSNGFGVQIAGTELENIDQEATEAADSADTPDTEATALDSGESSESERPLTDADSDDEDFECDIDFGSIGLVWLDRLITERRTIAICNHVKQDKGQRMLEQVVQNLPVGALIMLPLLAFLVKFMYPLSRRYYVEHLLMLVHYHSFLFLSASFLAIGNATLSWLDAPDWPFLILNISLGIYMPFYLYKALRRVYGQRRIITIFKYLLLFFGYLVAILATVFLIAIYIVITY